MFYTLLFFLHRNRWNLIVKDPVFLMEEPFCAVVVDLAVICWHQDLIWAPYPPYEKWSVSLYATAKNMYLVASFKIFLFIYNLAIYNLLLIQPLSSCVNCRKYQTRVAEKAVEKKNVTSSLRWFLGFVSLREDYSPEAKGHLYAIIWSRYCKQIQSCPALSESSILI